jgi:hypothetical protein
MIVERMSPPSNAPYLESTSATSAAPTHNDGAVRPLCEENLVRGLTRMNADPDNPRESAFIRVPFSHQATCLSAPITMKILCAFASLRLCVEGIFTSGNMPAGTDSDENAAIFTSGNMHAAPITMEKLQSGKVAKLHVVKPATLQLCNPVIFTSWVGAPPGCWPGLQPDAPGLAPDCAPGVVFGLGFSQLPNSAPTSLTRPVTWRN